MNEKIHLQACERCFGLECTEFRFRHPLDIVFAALRGSVSAEEMPAIDLGRIAVDDDRQGCIFSSAGAPAREIHGTADLIYQVDKDLTLALQRARSDLLFLHAAVVELEGQAIILSAPVGTGKSTTTFALLHHGFGYLSDELAPIDLRGGRVFPYPHALCLKAPPPDPYRLPTATLDAGETLHVPTTDLPALIHPKPLPIAGIVFLHRSAGIAYLGPRKLSAAETSAHLISNTLNLLAHPGAGTDAAISLARGLPAYSLDIRDLPSAISALRATFTTLL